MPKYTFTFALIDDSAPDGVTTVTVATRLFKCLGDRLAFEQRFGRSFASTLPVGIESAVGADGELDQTLLTAEQRAAILATPDIYSAYFHWRVLQRSPGYKDLSFEEFTDRIAEVTMTEAPAEALQEPDPLALAAPPTS